MPTKKLLLLILDGWGHGQNPAFSAIQQANTPFIDQLYQQYPNAELITYGEAVGLPIGQMGNSEVGHLNIGAGRIVYQELLRINNALKDKSLQQNPTLLEAIAYAKKHQKPIHLMGLVSDGGVHSHINHLIGLCNILATHQMTDVYIHAFTDGRDTDPNNGLQYLQNLQNALEKSTGQIASIIGRYYAMDRDKRWQRIKLAYDLLLKGKGKASHNLVNSIQAAYKEGITDEFMHPIVKVNQDGKPLSTIQKDDVIICFNFRTDRCRQITQVLTQKAMPKFDMSPLPLYYVTMTRYDKTFKGIHIIFEKENIQQTLGEILSAQGKKQIRIAETEKYPHVTFFFSGGQEQAFEGEKRILINSPKVATYDLQPEMSAYEITEAILPELSNQTADFICLNFANTDMVGHTGIFDAAVKAVETVDKCTAKIVEKALENNYQILVIADHGNADIMKNEDGSPHTAHTTNLVPIILVANDLSDKIKLKNGKLADIAPTILHLMNLAIPELMDGDILLE